MGGANTQMGCLLLPRKNHSDVAGCSLGKNRVRKVCSPGVVSFSFSPWLDNSPVGFHIYYYYFFEIGSCSVVLLVDLELSM